MAFDIQLIFYILILQPSSSYSNALDHTHYATNQQIEQYVHFICVLLVNFISSLVY